MKVTLIPIDRIRVVNPRVRDPEKFQEVVQSIATLGLKKPITVTPAKTNGDGQPHYDLVCGQGRLEAFQALGQTEIPAIVSDYSETSGLLASLVENIARRRVKPLDQIRRIQWMQAQHDDCAAIAQKTGLSEEYVRHVLTLLERGEDRLIEGVLQGDIPISIAIRIVGTNDEDSQRVLVDALERQELTQKTFSAFKRVLDHRKSFGRQRGERTPPTERPTAESLVNAYKRESQRQRLLIRKAKVCESRLLTLSAAFRRLLADEDYVTLLRAEKIESMPKFLTPPKDTP